MQESNLNAFRQSPPLPDYPAPPAVPVTGMAPEILDLLDDIVEQTIAGQQAMPTDFRAASRALSAWNKLPQAQRIYVALASSNEEMLHFLRLSIPEAIDKLGWPDASAMVARWCKRGAK